MNDFDPFEEWCHGQIASLAERIELATEQGKIAHRLALESEQIGIMRALTKYIETTVK